MSLDNITDGTYKNIMSDIESVLKKKSVSYSASQSEIVIPNRTKKEICGFIGSSLSSIPTSVMKILIDVVEVKNTVYIRKKMKL